MARKSTALSIVAWLLVFEGVFAVIRGVSGFSLRGFTVDISMLTLPVGLGLLWGSGWWRGSNFWRAAALVVIGLQLVAIIAIPLILVLKPVGLEPFFMLSQTSGPIVLVGVILLAVTVLKVWQFRVVFQS